MKDYSYRCISYNIRSCTYNDMCGMATSVKYETMLRYCDIKETMNKVIKDLFPFNRHEDKYEISYWKSLLRQTPCYYVKCKGIAYIFTKGRD